MPLPVLNCPACAAPMRHLSLDGKLGTHVDVDLCASCRVFWFDHLKELQLAPNATLNLFTIISEPAAGASTPVPAVMRCPRCNARLAPTHDVQRQTKFQYWRCPLDEGRLISYIDFLREKDFVRPLAQAQIDELKQSVKTVNCGNCGAPIDLSKDSVCGHCGSALSMLDPTQMARAVEQLKKGD
ncbi:MAG TPA: zf-TFIIB domain-containing protein [Vicinamibacterales bacterium]|nr:zf-TFIIB domain-containing protein [Vicinamibacterales bacterium]